MASSDTVSVERKVENLRAYVMKLAKSKCLLLPEPKILEQKLLDLCSSRIPDHPPYGAMIHRAITELNEAGGSSEEAISEFIKSKYNDLPLAHTSLLSYHLAKLVEKEEILHDRNNCYMLPRENDAAYVDEKGKKVNVALSPSDCCNGTNDRHVAETEDQLDVDQNLVTEATSDKKEEDNKGEEGVRSVECEEHKVENAGNLWGDCDSLTGAETQAEGEAGGEIWKSEILKVANSDRSLEEKRLTTETQLFSEKSENAVSEALENQDLQSCKLLEEEKEKREPVDGQHRETELLVEGRTVTLEDMETEERIEVNDEDDENRQKQDQEDETGQVTEEANHGEVTRIGITAKQGTMGLHPAVDVVKEASREIILERTEVDTEREGYKRLREKQTEVCCNIVALEKMLKRSTRSKERNEDIAANSGSLGVQHDDSLPLSKESCKQLWKFVHKIQGQLFEIFDSLDENQVSNSESPGHGVGSMKKGLFQEGPKKVKNPCNTGERDSHTKPRDEETRVKRSQDVEAVEPGESFGEQKRRKLCDGQTFPLLFPGGVTCDSSMNEEVEAGCKSSEAVAHVCDGEPSSSQENPPIERSPESIVNSETSTATTSFSDHPNINEKLGGETSVEVEISESSLQLPGQVTWRSDADKDLSKPSSESSLQLPGQVTWRSDADKDLSKPSSSG